MNGTDRYAENSSDDAFEADPTPGDDDLRGVFCENRREWDRRKEERPRSPGRRRSDQLRAERERLKELSDALAATKPTTHQLSGVPWPTETR